MNGAGNLDRDFVCRKFEEVVESQWWYTQKKMTKCRLSTRESIDLDILGISNMEDARSFKVIHILGVHFKAGEWGKKSCGSVITTIYNGRSRYCVVDKFIQVQNNNSMDAFSPQCILCCGV